MAKHQSPDDLGVADLRKEGRVTVTSVGRRGTTPYMAPEMFQRCDKTVSSMCGPMRAFSWRSTEMLVWGDFDESEIVGCLCRNPVRTPDVEDLPRRAKDLCTGCFALCPSKRPSMEVIVEQLLAVPLIEL